ncbi:MULTISPECIES: hypothetical protein [Halomonas]|uniref:hypothetical protein n=1 Tax=Halomonas TaxID=2745 RepID=UPI0018683169|nr:hypothetical protein [Halomonas citrativorans]
MKIVVFSSKRSTHHAFLESVLKGKNFYYQNNLEFSKGGLVPTKVVGDMSFIDRLHVASFEMNYNIEDVANSKELSCFFGINEEGGEKKLRKIIFLRDPLNTLASTLSVYKKFLYSDKAKSLAWVDKNMMQWVNVYEYYCQNADELEFIYANKFWLDSDYMSKISVFFGGGAKGLSSVSKFGGGGDTFFDNASQVAPEDLDKRYLLYSEDPIFLDFVSKYRNEMKKFLLDVGDEEKVQFVDAV